MRIAIPQWKHRVSPTLDDAGSLVLVDTEDGGMEEASVVPLLGMALLERAHFMRRLGVDFVICGAISRQFQLLLDAVGVEVIANTCGPVEHVVRTFLEGRGGESAGIRASSEVPGTSFPTYIDHVRMETGRISGMAKRSHGQ